MRFGFLLLLLSACALPTSPDQAATETRDSSATEVVSYSADAYVSCAACHLADGTGVPGAFPPIRDRAATMAGLAGGREYLITVASFGLMGTIDVAGMPYMGVMPGNTGTMTEEAIAASLNYLVFELVDEPADGIVSPFTAAEIGKTQSVVSNPNPQVAFDLRAELARQHGEEWPR